MKEVHTNYPSCPFCYLGFTNHQVLRNHIDQMHEDKTLKRVQGSNTNINRTNSAVITDNTVQSTNREVHNNSRSERKRGICAFFPQPRGCKKGLNCDFSHEQNGNNTLVKVPKLCMNGQRCLWKPRCRYIHPEDGEVMPQRVQRNQVQGFVLPDLATPPPGYSLASSTDFPGLQSIKVVRPWETAAPQLLQNTQ